METPRLLPSPPPLGSRAHSSWAQLSTGWGGTFPRISWIVPQWQEAGGEGEARRAGVEEKEDRSWDSVATGRLWWSLVNSGLPSRAFCALQDRDDQQALAHISFTPSHSFIHILSFLFS